MWYFHWWFLLKKRTYLIKWFVQIYLEKTGKCCKCQYFPDFFIHVLNGNHRKKLECSINQAGSAGSVKSNGAIDMFSNLLERYDLKYVYYNHDGDTEWYKKEVAEKLYGDFTPQKLECVKYVQKRFGTRLRKLRNEKKYEVIVWWEKNFTKTKVNRQDNKQNAKFLWCDNLPKPGTISCNEKTYWNSVLALLRYRKLWS